MDARGPQLTIVPREVGVVTALVTMNRYSLRHADPNATDQSYEQHVDELAQSVVVQHVLNTKALRSPTTDKVSEDATTTTSPAV
jgi:hypothetical protein